MFKLRLLLIICTLLAVATLTACYELDYYLHTAGGHMKIMVERKSISDLLTDQNTSEELRVKLKNIAWIRHFASDRLDLPENGSYQSYVELDRPYVVWNVVATPELSLEPLVWCFPFSGCISYRGYFNLKSAQSFAKDLQKEGYDITVSGVPAYSTLNWFDDPALSTFSKWSTSSVARLIFHELAHQKLYIPDDSSFNESFATSVALAGVELWLDRFADQQEKERYAQRLKREKQFLELTAETRQELKKIYDSEMTVQEKRERKEAVFSDLRHRYSILRKNWNGYDGYDPWFKTLNNAKFASVNTYHRWVPAFKLVMEQERHNLPDFYRRCVAISKLPQEKRSKLLDELAQKFRQQETDPASLTVNKDKT